LGGGELARFTRLEPDRLAFRRLSAHLLCLQVTMDQRDGHRALADRRGHPLHGVGPDVAGGEDAGNTALQVERIPTPIPSRWRSPISKKMGAGVYEPFLTPRHRVAEPVRTRLGADEHEQV